MLSNQPLLSDSQSLILSTYQTIMSSIVFNFGDTSKEVDLSEVNSVDDIASNMKEVINQEKETKEDTKNA